MNWLPGPDDIACRGRAAAAYEAGEGRYHELARLFNLEYNRRVGRDGRTTATSVRRALGREGYGVKTTAASK